MAGKEGHAWTPTARQARSAPTESASTGFRAIDQQQLFKIIEGSLFANNQFHDGMDSRVSGFCDGRALGLGETGNG